MAEKTPLEVLKQAEERLRKSIKELEELTGKKVPIE